MSPLIEQADPAGPAAPSRATQLVRQLELAGVSIATTLPDSWLPDLIDCVDRAPGIRHVRVTREDDGAAVCAGAALAGGRAALICQNAGLLLAANGLAAYVQHHQLPFLMLAVARGGVDDGFFYHAYKNVTGPVLDALGVPWHVLEDPADDHLIPAAMNQAWLHRRPVAVLCTHRALVGGGPA